MTTALSHGGARPVTLDDTRRLLARTLRVRCGDDERAYRVGAAELTDLERLARALPLVSHVARTVEVDAASLAHVRLPALALVDDHELVVIGALRGQHVELEHASGARERTTCGELAARIGGAVLSIEDALPRRADYLARVLAYLLAQRADLLKMGFLALCLTGLGMTGPLLTELTMDRALPERAPKLLAVVALGALGVAIQRALFTWLEQRVSVTLSARLESAAASHLFEHLMRIPFDALARRRMGHWLETLASGNHVQEVATNTLLAPLFHALTALAYGAMVASYDAALAGTLLGAGLSLVVVAVSFAGVLRGHEQRVIRASSRQHSALFELLTGVLTLRTSGAEQRGVLRWLARAIDVRASAVEIDRLGAWQHVLLAGGREATNLLVLVWAAHLCLHTGASVGAMLALVMLADRFVDAVYGVSSLLTPLLTARPHRERVDALLALPDVTAHASSASLGAASEAVVLEGVWFRYGPEDPFVLSAYDLRAERHEHKALRGPSGMGKSTVLRLIAGLYRPERGVVRVFARSPEELRGQIAYLPQDAHLFAGSIRQNLTLMSGHVAFERLREVARDTGLDAWVSRLPMGYETMLPSGGGNLSGGQRQWLVWTAAMASDRPLLLLDEALSQVDRITRRKLLDGARSAQRTIISVEHDL